MAKILYPTQQIIEGYLQGVYPSLGVGCLTPSIKTIGYIAQHHNQPGIYGTLGVAVNTLTGIDIPILLEGTNTSKGTIAIVAQDPYRNKKDPMLAPFKPFIKPIVGTPFAYHYSLSCYTQTKVYRLIIRTLLSQGYRVYITDAHKFYPNISGQRKTEIALLIDELDDIQKKYGLCRVVTFGKDAWDYINNSKYNNIQVPLLHPSQQNWPNWRLWIFEQAYFEQVNQIEPPYWSKFASQIGVRSNMFGSYSINANMDKIIARISLDQI